MATQKAKAPEADIATVTIPAPITQPTAGGAAPADVDEGREAAKQEVRDALAKKD